jgi:hypothetical protein
MKDQMPAKTKAKAKHNKRKSLTLIPETKQLSLLNRIPDVKILKPKEQKHRYPTKQYA